MRDGPYHHGNLRAELLAAAGQTLRERGPDRISLRELARETGVSKSAPSRHFRDRQSLLNALAVAGFERLDDEMVRAVAGAGTVLGGQLRAAAEAFVDFAVNDAALLDLMFSLAKADGVEGVAAAADRLYTTFGGLIQRGQDEGELRPGSPTRLKLLMSATFQGIASLVSTGRVPSEETPALLDDAVDLFRAGRAQEGGSE